eukprot:s2802_g3.t1
MHVSFLMFHGFIIFSGHDGHRHPQPIADRIQDTRRLALLTSCDALTRDEPQRLTAVLALRALLAWNRLLEVGTRRFAPRKVKRSICDVLGVGARREATTLMSNALAAWRSEVQQVRGGRWLWRRRENCSQLSDLVETRDRLSFFLRDWFLRWRCSLWESRAETFASELHLLASMLQESTITCRELRTQLLTLRGSSCLGRAALCAVLVAWQRVVTERIQDMGGRPAPAAPAALPTAATATAAPEPRSQRTVQQGSDRKLRSLPGPGPELHIASAGGTSPAPQAVVCACTQTLYHERRRLWHGLDPNPILRAAEAVEMPERMPGISVGTAGPQSRASTEIWRSRLSSGSAHVT